MNKRNKKNAPEVHVLGDLKDVKRLVSLVNKRKSLVIFRNGETGSFHAEVEGDILKYTSEDINHLEKHFRLIYFDFFPSRKKIKVSSTAPQDNDSNTGAGVDQQASTEKKKTEKSKSKEKKREKANLDN